MIYILLVALLIAFFILYPRYSARTKRRKQLEQVRRAWGNPKNEFFNFDIIGKYALTVDGKRFHQLSTQTLLDADFYELFGFVDRTTSRIGQQFLLRKMIQPDNDLPALRKLDERADFFTDNPSLREEIQLELSRLNNFDAYYISSLLQDKLLQRPRWLKFIPISIIITVMFLALAIKFPVFLIVLIVPVTINMLIHYWNKENILHFIRSFPQLNILIDVCHQLSKKHINQMDTSIAKYIDDLKPFRQQLGLLGGINESGIKTELSQVTGYFIELLKGFFLIEVFTLFRLIEVIETKKQSIAQLFNYVGEIDVTLSVASLRAGSLKTCKPHFTAPEKKISARSIYHPLIKNCVKNDIAIHSKSVLITGSNMSGKTTFLRTILLNTILAQTIYTCFADEFETPIVKQFSSIRIDDSVMEGKSYYFEEANVMAALINEVSSGNQNIFILDEVFRGTNTIERIASAKAILSYLNFENNIVVVSTHDLELSQMLEHDYDLYHFSETMQDQEFHFDHKLKHGRLRTRNAIRILELLDYPKQIIDEAQHLSNILDNGSAAHTENTKPSGTP